MKVDKSLLSGSNTLLVLSLLKKEKMYGYQIIQTLAEKSEQAFIMQEGTLYPILHSLEKQGMVKTEKQTTENNRVRKYYEITKKGSKYLDEKTKEWIYYIQKVNQVILDMESTFA